jgi:putative endonuclease
MFIYSKSINKDFIYIGSTNDLKRRFAEHNEGLSRSTSPYKPFIIDAYIAVRTESKVRDLKKYLKIGSGKAFLKKRILTDEASA